MALVQRPPPQWYVGGAAGWLHVASATVANPTLAKTAMDANSLNPFIRVLRVQVSSGGRLVPSLSERGLCFDAGDLRRRSERRSIRETILSRVRLKPDARHARDDIPKWSKGCRASTRDL
jgi:hypothetical protein